MVAVRASIMNAIAYPLCPPKGDKEPFTASAGSVVGWPLLSRAQSVGRDSPRAAAFLMRPRATMVLAISSTSGHLPEPRGMAIDHGFAPSTAFHPPKAAIAGLELVSAIPMKPACVARIV